MPHLFSLCIGSGNSLRGMLRSEPDDDDAESAGGTPNDTAHGGSKFSSSSWKRKSSSGKSALPSPARGRGTPATTPTTGSSAEAGAPVQPRASMEPVMERTASALTDLEAVKFLVEDWSHKQWRPATPQDQERFARLETSDIKPLVALGEGSYGSVNLCRIAAQPARPQPQPSLAARSTPSLAARTAVAASHSARGSAASPFGGAAAEQPQPRSHVESRRGGSEGGAMGALGPADAPTASAEGGAAAAALPTAGGGTAAGEASSSSSSSSAAVAAAGGGAGGSQSQPCLPSPSSGTAGEATASAAGPGSASSSASTSSSPSSSTASSASAAGPAAAAALATASSLGGEAQLIVAVKRVPLGWNQERELMQLHRCQRCPFIVRLFGFVDDGTEHCSYVMEWAEGGDLGNMLASLKDRRGANKQRLLMSESSARYYFGCLLLALEFLHANRLLHRDIKPSNLLLTSDGTAKLADLGFTVALDPNGQTVGCCGTTGYIAPEVFSYGSAKSRMAYGVPADLWSSAATLYQILTGNVVTDKHEEVLRKGWHAPTHPRFSPVLQDLLNRMLAPKPTSRPQSVASVMHHAWFAGFDWAALRGGAMKAPYVPAERRRMRQVAEDVLDGGSSGPPPSGPPPAAAGGQRLETVLERLPSAAAAGAGAAAEAGPAGEEVVVQRSALSGRGEGSVRRGREGLVRAGSSFETALGTLTLSEAQHAAGALASGGVAAGGGGGGAAQHAHGEPEHGVEGLVVQFGVGAAKCA